VNLIPYNKVKGLPWERPDEETQEKFLAALGKAKGGRHLAPRKRPRTLTPRAVSCD